MFDLLNTSNLDERTNLSRKFLETLNIFYSTLYLLLKLALLKTSTRSTQTLLLYVTIAIVERSFFAMNFVKNQMCICTDMKF